MHLLLITALSILIFILFKFLYSTIWVPFILQNHFRKQGVRGPSYRPIYGNSTEIRQMFSELKPKSTPLDNQVLQCVSPFYYRWSRMYGKTVLYWFGSRPRLAIVDLEMVKEVLMNTCGSYPKLQFNPSAKTLFGQGLVGLLGETWAFHRRIANQAFTMERVKVICYKVFIFH